MNSKFLKSALCLTVLCAFNDSAFSSESSNEKNNNLIEEHNFSSDAQVNNLEDINSVENNENNNTNFNEIEDEYNLNINSMNNINNVKQNEVIDNNNNNIDFNLDFNGNSINNNFIGTKNNEGNSSENKKTNNYKLVTKVKEFNSMNINNNINKNNMNVINKISSNITGSSVPEIDDEYKLQEYNNINDLPRNVSNNKISGINNMNRGSAARQYYDERMKIVKRIGSDELVKSFDKLQEKSIAFVKDITPRTLKSLTSGIEKLISGIEELLNDDKGLIEGQVDTQLLCLKNFLKQSMLYVGTNKKEDSKNKDPNYKKYHDYYSSEGVQDIYEEIDRYIQDKVINDAKKYQLLYRIQLNSIDKQNLTMQVQALQQEYDSAFSKFQDGTMQDIMKERDKEIQEINAQITQLQNKIKSVQKKYDKEVQKRKEELAQPYQSMLADINEQNRKLKMENKENEEKIKKNDFDALKIKNDMREKLEIYIENMSINESLSLAMDYVEKRSKLKKLFVVCNNRIDLLNEFKSRNNKISKVNSDVLSVYGDVIQFNNRLNDKNFTTGNKQLEIRKKVMKSEANRIDEEENSGKDEKEGNNNNINNEENNNNINNEENNNNINNINNNNK